MAEKSQKPLSYFFKRRKQCEDESDKESTTMQVAHEELNDVDDPTEEINRGWIMIKKTTRWSAVQVAMFP